MIWTTTPVACACGLCGRRLVAGDRIALLTSLRKVRCPECVAPPPAPPVALGEDLPLDAEALALDVEEADLNAAVEARVLNFRNYFKAPEPLPPVMVPREPGDDDA